MIPQIASTAPWLLSAMMGQETGHGWTTLGSCSPCIGLNCVDSWFLFGGRQKNISSCTMHNYWSLSCIFLISSIFYLILGALDLTTEWIRESIEEELASVASETSSNSGATAISKSELKPTLVLTNSYLKLLKWDYQQKTIPEVNSESCSPLMGLKMLCLSPCSCYHKCKPIA